MSVFVSVEDQDGEPLVDVFEVEKIYKRFPRDAGLCLRFVGDAEDASFNAIQTPMLAAELEALAQAKLGAEEKKELERLVALCRKHAGKRHEYIRFYGETKSE